MRDDTRHDRTERQKAQAAQAALEFVVAGSVLGIGSGSTVERFIEQLAASQLRIAGAVAASVSSERSLRAHHIPVMDLREIGRVPVYIDGADEADDELRLIKGGGGALTREKIIACSAELFVCIAEESKLVERLGAFPVAIEVIPMAAVHVARRIERLGGSARERTDFVTDNGNLILDASGLDFRDPVCLERELSGIAGVVESGVFARRPADVLLLGTDSGVERFERIRPGNGFEQPQGSSADCSAVE